MHRFASALGWVSNALAVVAAALLAIMMLMICTDVLLRNLPLSWGFARGLEWSNEISESMLYLMTMLVAPWLLRQGQHIRVDILLRALPSPVAWACELVCDVLALACCLVMVWYGVKATAASYASGSMVIKALVTPEWWSLAVLPACFFVLALEVVVRLWRLWTGPRAVRGDAVSAS